MIHAASMSLCHAEDMMKNQDAFLSDLSTVLHRPLGLVDLDSSFVGNGGDSSALIQLLALWKTREIQVSITSIFEAKTLRDLAIQFCDQSARLNGHILKTHQSSVGRVKRRCSISASQGPGPKRHAPSKDSVPKLSREASRAERFSMTELQQALVQSSINDPSRNIIHYHETHLSENVPALKEAWEKVLGTESIFRMTFEVDEAGGYLRETQGLPFVWHDIVCTDKQAYQDEVESSLPPQETIGFSFKAVTLNIGGTKDRATIIWRTHHALVDGASCAIIRAKVQQAMAGQEITPGRSFLDFSQDLRMLQAERHESGTAFWTRQKVKYPSPSASLLIPLQTLAQKYKSHCIQKIPVDYDLSQLSDFARTAGVTLPSVYYTAWALVMARYTDNNQVCFGAILSGRTLPITGVESVVGPIINTLPFLTSLDDQSTIHGYLRNVFNSLLDLTSFQWTTPEHGFKRDFQTAINVHLESPGGATLGCLEKPYSRVLTDFPIHVEVEVDGTVDLHYNGELCDEAQMRRLGASLGNTLRIITDPTLTVGSCMALLSETENRSELEVVGNWNAPSTTMGHYHEDLVSLFLKNTEEFPTAIALQQDDHVLTYADFYQQFSRVAQSLANYVKPGDVVCVHADGSINGMIAIYAILKAGAVYCPFDPKTPRLIRDTNYLAANGKLFLAGNKTDISARPDTCTFSISVEELLKETSRTPLDEPRSPRPGSPAYICFTSGSTGKPKGVVCRHESLVAFQKDFAVRLCARPGWRIAQCMSPAFDGSIHEIFSALSYGATLVLKDSSDPFHHLKSCDAAVLTPSVAMLLDPADFPQLQHVYLVGEVVPQAVCDAWSVKEGLYNMYGPTEATCGATIKVLAANKPVTLGRPNPSTRVYILDGQRKLAPRGVIGELYLAGVQVATEYVGRPDETGKRFFPDSICPQYVGERMYKTGDRACWDEKGELIFQGRIDRQIKLRGFRIDLDDIELRLAQADSNCTAAAVTSSGDHLVAFVQPANLDVSDFRAKAQHHVPIYAMPRHIVAVESFPMTSCGKLDYQAVVAPTRPGDSQDAPCTTAERVITAAISDVMGIPSAKIDSEFSLCDLGGSSMLSLLLKHKLSRAFKKQIPMHLMLDAVSIKDMATAIQALDATTPKSKVQYVIGEQQLSPIEKDWWLKYQHHSGTSSFNVPFACELPVSAHRVKLVSAWNTVLDRHRILRCRYRRTGSCDPVREYFSEAPQAKQVDKIDVQEQVNIPFNLAEDYLIRVMVSETQMLVVVSHIICDLTTLNILLREVATIYQEIELPPIAKIYAETSWPVGVAPEHLEFWSSYLGLRQSAHLAVGRSNMHRKTWSGSSYIGNIPASTYQEMTRYTAREGVTLQQLAIATVALALQYDTDVCDITIGAPYMNRQTTEDLNVVGLFLEPLPIRVRYPLEGQSSETTKWQASCMGGLVEDLPITKAVQLSSRAALANAIPWTELLAHLGLKQEYPGDPIMDVMVTFHEAGSEVQFPIGAAQLGPIWGEGAKFKLMVEFSALPDGSLAMRLEYSDECFEREDVELVGRLLLVSLQGILAGDEYCEILGRLRSLAKRP